MNGLKVYKKLEDLPKNMKFGVISFIDSFYYTITPKDLLSKVYNQLFDDGLLVIRILNRNWLVKYDKRIRNKKICTALNDNVIGYSKKSIIYLLKNNGFEILKSTSIEYGKNRSKRDRLLYSLVAFLYNISYGLFNFLPGIIVIAKKNPNYINKSI